MNAQTNNQPKKDNRKYKYGSLSVVFTVVFIALILVINFIFSALSLSGDLTVDLTQEEFSTVGEESQRLLNELGKDLDITIYFMSARDQFDIAQNNYNGVNLTGIIRDLAENYANIYDGSGDKGTIKVEYKELDKDPEFEKKYLEEATTTLSNQSIIVQGKYHYRILNMQAFYIKDGNTLTSFNGEYRLTSAILQSSISEPQVATLTYGHGEPIEKDGSIASDSKIASLVSLLTNAGFEVKTCDISREEIDSRTEVVISYGPVTDFSFDEIDKLTNYLGKRNAFIVFADSSTPKLPNLQSCLNDNWGINYKPFYRLTDETHSLGKFDIIKASYPEVSADLQDTTVSYQIRKTVEEFGAINTALPESVALEIKPNITQDGFMVETIMSSYDTAIASDASGEKISGQEIPLMLISTKQGYGENNAYEYSYVMLIGSTDYASSGYLTSESYGNKRVLLSALRHFATNRVAPDIKAKSFGSVALEIETGTARTLTYLICTIVPGIILILGLVVFFKRRHL